MSANIRTPSPKVGSVISLWSVWRRAVKSRHVQVVCIGDILSGPPPFLRWARERVMSEVSVFATVVDMRDSASLSR